MNLEGITKNYTEQIHNVNTKQNKQDKSNANSIEKPLSHRKSIAPGHPSSKNLNANTDREDVFGKELSSISISSYEINRVLRKLDQIVAEKEKHRNYKLISDFERERSNLENEQIKIRSQIEDISHINSNEKFINQIKEEKNRQQELFNKYYKINSEIVGKINKLNELVPALDEKIRQKNTKLKAVSHENLLLMEEIQKLREKKLEEYKRANGIINIEETNQQVSI